jgi:hypothetical protein
MAVRIRGALAALLLITTTLVGLTAGAVSAQSGRDLFVSPAGRNTNNGTSVDAAWGTLQHAAAQLRAGDTLWVLDGDYSPFNVTASGSAGAYIRIAAYPGDSPRIDAGEKTGILVSDAAYVEVRGLEIRGNADTDQDSNGIGILVIGESHHIRFVQNEIHHFGSGGLITYHSGDHLEIYHNTIHHNANWNPSQHSGVSLLGLVDDGTASGGAYNNYVIGNLIYANEVKVKTDQFGQGTRITDGNCFVVDVTLESFYNGNTLFGSNICVNNGGRGVQVYKSADVDVVNNTFYHNMRSPDVAAIGSEVMAYDSKDVRFANNLIISRDGVLPLTAGITSPVQFQNNLTVGTLNPQKDPSDRHLPAGSSVLVNASTAESALTAANFTPTATSAALDSGAGGFASALAVDFVGNVRRSGGAADAGAIERGAAANTSWPWAGSLTPPSGQAPPSPTPQPVPTADRVDMIGRLYSAAFLRPPDQVGLDYWVDSSARGLDIAHAFSVSEEFVNRYGRLDDAGFLDRIYRNVLGRAPDQAGFDYWMGKMDDGLSKHGLLFYFSDSAEYRTGN